MSDWEPDILDEVARYSRMRRADLVKECARQGLPAVGNSAALVNQLVGLKPGAMVPYWSDLTPGQVTRFAEQWDERYSATAYAYKTRLIEQTLHDIEHGSFGRTCHTTPCAACPERQRQGIKFGRTRVVADEVGLTFTREPGDPKGPLGLRLRLWWMRFRLWWKLRLTIGMIKESTP